MKKQTIITIIVICSMILCLSLPFCKSESNSESNSENDTNSTYNCSTCLDKGYVDCPNCHVTDCGYCQDGVYYKRCTNCDGRSYSTTELCLKCYGDGYNSSGYKCFSCNGHGVVKIDCPSCSNGIKVVYGCGYCDGTGYEGGTKCSDGSCSRSVSKNNGYTYIDCPDCEER